MYFKLSRDLLFTSHIAQTLPTQFFAPTSRKALKNGKEDHDKAYLEIDLDIVKSIQPHVTTKKTPYSPNVMTDAQEKKKLELVNFFETYHSNLIPDDRDWEGTGTDLQGKLTYYLRWRKQELCQGTVSVNRQLMFH